MRKPIPCMCLSCYYKTFQEISIYRNISFYFVCCHFNISLQHSVYKHFKFERSVTEMTGNIVRTCTLSKPYPKNSTPVCRRYGYCQLVVLLQNLPEGNSSHTHPTGAEEHK